jgi:hypothetical protein
MAILTKYLVDVVGRISSREVLRFSEYDSTASYYFQDPFSITILVQTMDVRL